MHIIKKNPILTKAEINNLALFFNLSRIKKTNLIKQGNINTNVIVWTSKGKYVFRKYSFKNKKQIVEEVKFVNSLSIPVPRIIGVKNNVVCYEYIKGKPLKRPLLKYGLKAIKLLAKMHLLTKTYKYNYPGEGLEIMNKIVRTRKKSIVNSKFKDGRKFVEVIKSELRKFRFPNLPQSIVHVDLKPENIIVNKGKISIIDFDNAYRDKCIIDIGSTIMWWCCTERGLDIVKAKKFLVAYEKVKKLSKLEEKYLTMAIKFNLLKQAFKYAYICLPRLKFAEENAYYFIDSYKKISKQNFP